MLFHVAGRFYVLRSAPVTTTSLTYADHPLLSPADHLIYNAGRPMLTSVG